MARKKKEESGGGGSPAWMATFSDLMNLLLCFFVLLFAMSSIDEEKMELIIASFQTRFNVLNGGSTTIQDGDAIGAGLKQLSEYDTIYMPDANSNGKGPSDSEGIQQENHEEMDIDPTVNDPAQTDQNEPYDPSQDNASENQGGMSYEEQAQMAESLDNRVIQDELEMRNLEESERIRNQVERDLDYYGLQNQVEVNFNAQYVMLTLNGAILFDSGQIEVREDAMPLVEKLAYILDNFQSNIIEVEGHTDNVPIRSGRFEDNNVLSMYRALTVADYLREHTTITPAYIKSSGRGDYLPIADNTTPEGRARNRRVVIKIYNSYNSDISDEVQSESRDMSTPEATSEEAEEEP